MKMIHGENKEVSQLNQITDRLLALAEIDQLCFSSYNFGNRTVKELLVLTPKINSQHLLEVRPIVGMVMCAHSHVKYQIYYVDEIRRSILRGGGAFIERCHFDNLVYINPKSSPVMNKIPDIQAYLKKATRNFELECSKIESFKEGADFYFKKICVDLK